MYQGYPASQASIPPPPPRFTSKLFSIWVTEGTETLLSVEWNRLVKSGRKITRLKASPRLKKLLEQHEYLLALFFFFFFFLAGRRREGLRGITQLKISWRRRNGTVGFGNALDIGHGVSVFAIPFSPSWLVTSFYSVSPASIFDLQKKSSYPLSNNSSIKIKSLPGKS